MLKQTSFRIPTFEELVNKINKPKTTPTGLEIDDVDSVLEDKYKLPEGWKIKQVENGVFLKSPRGNVFNDVKFDNNGKLSEFKATLPTGRTITQLPQVSANATGTMPFPPALKQSDLAGQAQRLGMSPEEVLEVQAIQQGRTVQPSMQIPKSMAEVSESYQQAKRTISAEEAVNVLRGIEQAPKETAGQTAIREFKSPEQFIPFVSSAAEYFKLSTANKAAQAIEAGQPVSQQELQQLYDYIYKASVDKTFGSKVIEVLAKVPAFAGEIAATGGIASGVKQGGMSALKRILGSAMEGKLVNLLARGTAALVGAGMSAIPAAGVRTPAGTIERQLVGTLTGDEEGIWESASKAFGSAWVEAFSERTGGVVGEIAAPIKGQLLKIALFNSISKLNPMKSSAEISKFLNTFGYNGVLGEMFEERVSDLGNAALGIQPLALPSGEQLLTELVAFSIPGMANVAVTTGMSAIDIANQIQPMPSHLTPKTPESQKKPVVPQEQGITPEVYNIDSVIKVKAKEVELAKSPLDKSFLNQELADLKKTKQMGITTVPKDYFFNKRTNKYDIPSELLSEQNKSITPTGETVPTTETGQPEKNVVPTERKLRGNPNPQTIKKMYESTEPVIGDTFVTPQGNTWEVVDINSADTKGGMKKPATEITIQHSTSGRQIKVFTEKLWDITTKHTVPETVTAVAKAPNEQPMSAELESLHNHPARLSRFGAEYAETERYGSKEIDEQIKDYLKKIKSYAEKNNPKYLPEINALIREAKEGSISEAVISNERVLQKLHGDESVQINEPIRYLTETVLNIPTETVTEVTKTPAEQPKADITPEVDTQLKELGWTDEQISEFDQAEVNSILKYKQKPTLFQTSEVEKETVKEPEQMPSRIIEEPVKVEEVLKTPAPPLEPSGRGTPPDSPLGKIQGMWDRGRDPRKKPRDPNKPTLMENINDAYYELRKMQTRVDKGQPVLKGGKNDLITLITNSPGAVNAGVTRTKLTLDAINKAAPDVSSDDINSYVYIQHAREVLKEMGQGRVMAGGFTSIDQIDQAEQELMEKLGDKFDQVHEAARILTDRYDTELTRMVEAGLVSEEDAAVFRDKYAWYNPLDYLDDIDELQSQGKSTKPFNVISNGIKRLTQEGTSKDVVAPLNVLGDQLIRNEVRIVKNNLNSAIIGLAKQDKQITVKKVSGVKKVAIVDNEDIYRRPYEDIEGTLSFFENGVRQIYEVPDFIWRESNVLTKTTKNPVASIVGSINGITRSAFTSASIPFVVSNIANDSLTAFMNRGITPAQTINRLLLSLRGLEKDKVMQAFRLSGGLQARFYGQTGEEMAKAAKLAGRGKETTGGTSFIKRVLKDATKPIEWAGELGEQSPRMAFYAREMDKTLKGWRKMNVEDVVKTPESKKAAAGAVELTINFARGGHLIKQANPYILFLNAAFEGTKLPYRALRDNPAARWRLAVAVVGMIGLTAYNLTRKEYMDIPDYQRWGSVVVMLPPKEQNADGTWKPNYVVVIPKTREWSMFLGSAAYIMEKMYAENPADVGEFASELFTNVSPINDLPLMPIIQEPLEQISNYDIYTGRKIVSESLQNLPAEEQTYPSIPTTVEELSKVTGMSPARVHHALNGLFGGAYKAAASVIDFALGLFVADETNPEILKMAEEYNSLPLEGDVTREDYLKSLTASDKRKLLNYINRGFPDVPIVDPIIDRFYPERGGRLEDLQYQLDKRTEDLPSYYRDTLTDEQKVNLDVELWEDRKLEGAKLLERYKIDNLGEDSNSAKSKYLADNPEIDVARLMWDNTTTIHSVEAAKLLKQKAEEYGIPLESIPAFKKYDDGRERFPINEKLWQPVIEYDSLPSKSIFSYEDEESVKGFINAGIIDSSMLEVWRRYRAFTNNTNAKSSYKRKYKILAKSTWREDYRRANKDLEAWLVKNRELKALK